MNICDHLVKDTEIIGIGPLMLERSKDLTELSLYGTHRFSFELHLKNHTIIIKSDWVDSRGRKDDQLTGYKKMSEEFKAKYHSTREKVAEQISEITEKWPT